MGRGGCSGEGTVSMSEKQHCRFFLLRYVPDAVKTEFVNFGLVLLPPAGPAEVRFTRDFSTLQGLDPAADLDLLAALEADLRRQLAETSGPGDMLLQRIGDSFSNGVQASEMKACLADSPAQEADLLARIYLEHARFARTRESSRRDVILQGVQSAFEKTGVWRLMQHRIAASTYTHPGDPLRIDCGYGLPGRIKMFHAVSLQSDPNSAKVLAYTFPRMAEGMRRQTSMAAELTVVIDQQPEQPEDAVLFAMETLRQQSINLVQLAELPVIAATAAQDLGIG